MSHDEALNLFACYGRGECRVSLYLVDFNSSATAGSQYGDQMCECVTLNFVGTKIQESTRSQLEESPG